MDNPYFHKEQIKKWREKLRDYQKNHLTKARSQTNMFIHKRGGYSEDVISSEYTVEDVQKCIDSMKKVVRNLRKKIS